MECVPFYGGKRGPCRMVTLQETVDFLETNNRTTTVTILPPVSGDQDIPSDEELCDEQSDELFEPAGELEVSFASNSSDEEDNSHEENILPDSRYRKRTGFTKPILLEKVPTNVEEKFPQLTTKSCYEIWKLFFTNDICNHILEQTKLYARRDKNDATFDVSVTDIKNFLGIIIFSGYHFVTSERDYWSNQPDLNVPFVSDTMSRDKYLKIKKYFHVADNQNLETGNKVAKVSFLYETLNEQLSNWGIFHEKLSIDESMVPYFGKHSAKMYIKGKPIRFGYKLWALCGNDGYPYKLQIYTGKDSTRRSETPVGQQVVQDMLEVVKQKSSPKFHEIYFDNFFTSGKLMKLLSEEGFIATGTVRENRTDGASKVMISKIQLKKQNRGSYDYRCNGEVFVCKWHDNSIVNITINYFTHEPVHKVKRRVRTKGNTEVNQPNLINLYNKGMGGVDLMDRLLGSYRPSIRAKKWWWPLTTNMLNLSLVAVWRFFLALHPNDDKISHLDFRREITIVLMKSTKRLQATGGRHADLPTDVRFDGHGHEPTECSQGRCVVCHKNTRSMCGKCNLRLHYSRGTQCLKNYHTR